MCCISGERGERVCDKCFDRERDCELREFRVRESRKCEFRDRESRNCVTVNLVSAAFVIASAASLTFERMSLILNEIVNIPSSVFCQISHSASWRCFTIRVRVIDFENAMFSFLSWRRFPDFLEEDSPGCDRF